MVRVYYVTFFFSLSWESMGTGSTWAYYNFHLYFYNGIPVALLLGWPAWLVTCYFLVDLLKRKLRLSNSFLVRSFLTFLSGMIVGFFVEVIGVGLGWWRYLPPLPKSWSIYVVNGWIHVITFIGWGLIAFILFEIANSLYYFLRRRVGKNISLGMLLPLSIIMGVFIYVILGYLYLSLPWSRE